MPGISFLKKHPGYFLFFFTLFVRCGIVFFILHPDHYLQFITYENDIRAQGFALGQTIFNPEQWSYYYLPLGFFYKFLLFLGLLQYKIIAVSLLNIFFGAMSIVLFYAIARRFLSLKIAFIVSCIGALFYPFIYFNALTIGENSFIFFFIAALYLFLRKPSLSKIEMLSIGTLLGLAYLVRPLLFFFFPLLIVWILLQKHPSRIRFQTAALICLPIFGLVLVAGIINQQVSQHKQFVFSASGAPNFAMTQCHIKVLEYTLPSGEYGWFAPPIYQQSNYASIITNIPFQNTAYYRDMGINCLIQDPKKFSSNLINIPNSFFGPLNPDFINTSWHKYLILFSSLCNFGFFVLFLLYPFLEKNNQRKKDAVIFYLLIGGVFCSIFLGNPGESRYGFTFFLIFLLIGTQTLVLLQKRLSVKKRHNLS